MRQRKHWKQNQCYAGAVGTDSYAEGVNVATKMLDNGITKALVLGGSVGDTIHDARVEGFTETFEKGGGEVLGAGRCTDTTEGTTKFDDLLSAYGDAQGAYALSGDYAIAAISALDNHPQADVKMYVSAAILRDDSIYQRRHYCICRQWFKTGYSDFSSIVKELWHGAILSKMKMEMHLILTM